MKDRHLTFNPGILGALKEINAYFDRAIEAAAPKPKRPQTIDTHDMLVSRHINGADYDDIPVQIEVERVYQGSGDPDDPTHVEFGMAFVAEDVPAFGHNIGDFQTDKYVFRNGDLIELTDEELKQAQDEYLNL